jgi:transposase InsO family protein
MNRFIINKAPGLLTIGFSIQANEPIGMGESFVKTFKRDYVWLGDLSSAEKVMGQLPRWFADYNESAPHKGLNMLSPRQYIRSRSSAA